MLQPIHLPSGRVVDLDKCIALIPNSTSHGMELVVTGIEHHLQLDAIDSDFLANTIQQQSVFPQPRYMFELRTFEEESRRREQVGERLKALQQKREELSKLPDADKSFQMMLAAVDAERAEGYKLYSNR